MIGKCNRWGGVLVWGLCICIVLLRTDAEQSLANDKIIIGETVGRLADLPLV
jgi:hypothetical protein